MNKSQYEQLYENFLETHAGKGGYRNEQLDIWIMLNYFGNREDRYIEMINKLLDALKQLELILKERK